MDPIVMAIIVVTVIGLVGAVILVAASIFMYVPVDERVEKITAALPGANCGACGCAGCADYAKCVVEEGAPVNKCVPGGAKAAAAIAEIMGVEAGASVAMKAVVGCSGTCEKTGKQFEFEGIHSCQAVKGLYGGDGMCKFGCLGYGDCVKACRFDALEIVQGTAKVNPDKCVGCTACVHVCPQELPVIVPYKGAKMVPCASKDDPEVRKQLCWVGCIGCGDCVDNCPDGLIHLEDGRAVIEPDRCEDCNICSYVCPNGVITAREMPEFTYVQVRAMAAQKGGAAK